MDLESDLNSYMQSSNVLPERVKTFIKRGANVNQHNLQNGRTPLHCAVLKRNINFEVIKLLLKNGASVDARNSLSGTCDALLYAVKNVNMTIKVIKLLLKYKANVNVVNPKTGFTVLQYACRNHNIDLKIIKLLLENGADVNAKNCQDGECTALLYATRNNNLKYDVIELLLNYDADIHARNIKDGFCTAFLYAVKNPGVSAPVVQMLIDRGSYVHATNARDNNANALRYALTNRTVNRDVVEILLKQKAKVNTAPYDMKALKAALSNPSMTGDVIDLMLQYCPGKLAEICHFHINDIKYICVTPSILNYAMFEGKTSFEVVRVVLDRVLRVSNYFGILQDALLDFTKSENSRLACFEILKYVVVQRVREEPLCISDFYTCKSVLGVKYYRLVFTHPYKNIFAPFVRSCIAEILHMKNDGIYPMLFPCTEIKERSIRETQKLCNRLVDMWSNNTYPLYLGMIGSNTKSTDVLNMFIKFRMYTYEEGTKKTIFLDEESTLKIVKYLSMKDMLGLVWSYYAFSNDLCDAKPMCSAKKK